MSSDSLKSYDSNQLETWKAKTAGLSTEEFLAWAVETFGAGLSFATSLGAEDQVLLFLLEKTLGPTAGETQPRPEVFSLDTGRLPQATYDLLQKNRTRFTLPIKTYFPDSRQVEDLVNTHGPNLFYDSLDNRKACCAVRKVNPLKRALEGKTAWVTGLRQGQAATRTALDRITWDQGNGLWKLNPLADWTSDQVWALIRAEKIPYSALHDQGYPSIGCEPCTRAIKPGEDERAGRWWWENPDHKECGLHADPTAGTKSPQFSFGKL